jgi:hypothetical protein
MARSDLTLGVALILFSIGVFALPSFFMPLLSPLQGMVEEWLSGHFNFFLSLSAIKGILGVLEGSSVGLSLGAAINVELGDVFEPAFDFVDTIWGIFIPALIILLLYKILLGSHLIFVGVPIIGFGFIARGLGYLIVGERLLSLGVKLLFSLPLLLLLNLLFTTTFLAPLKEARSDQLQSMKEEIYELNNAFFALKDDISIWAPQRSMVEVQKRFESFSDKVGLLSSSGFKTLLEYLVIVLVEILLLPGLGVYAVNSLIKVR